ncbi:hypothetical protein KIPB_007981 [Kipferlia bialata]|uniref:Armadillo-like helical n=1 Tax=Kipferlia bialata TaxID=797122 RepID=A0A9K3D2L9_9EUKA|nr:hypothetical protein KIPB_007981 [Kipferlia bialata]|eukprot:g7981.t1
MLLATMKEYTDSVKGDLRCIFPSSGIAPLASVIRGYIKDEGAQFGAWGCMLMATDHMDDLTPCMKEKLHVHAVKAITTHKHSINVCMGVVAVLSNLSEGDHKNIHVLLAEAGVVKALRTAMVEHGAEVPLLVRRVMTALRWMSDTDAVKPHCVVSGCHKWALEAMSMHIQDVNIVHSGASTLLHLHQDNSVAAHLMRKDSLRTIVAVMNLHMEHQVIAGTLMCTLNSLMRIPCNYAALQEMGIPECVSRYARIHPRSRVGDMMQWDIAKASELQAETEAEADTNAHYVLTDADIESLILMHREPEYLASLLLPRDVEPLELQSMYQSTSAVPPEHAVVLYLPFYGERWLSGFTATLETSSLSVLNLMSIKNPSALKKELAKRPQIVVCTHRTPLAKEKTKRYKIHMCLWREMLKMGVRVRGYMFLDEENVAEDEAAARTMYTDLASTVETVYLKKQTADRQKEMAGQGDTLQCLPANRYFEEVWMGVCERYKGKGSES